MTAHELGILELSKTTFPKVFRIKLKSYSYETPRHRAHSIRDTFSEPSRPSPYENVVRPRFPNPSKEGPQYETTNSRNSNRSSVVSTKYRNSQVNNSSNDYSDEAYLLSKPQRDSRRSKPNAAAQTPTSRKLPPEGDLDQSSSNSSYLNSVLPRANYIPAIPEDTASPAATFVVLKGIARAFAGLPYNDFETRAALLARNPELLDGKLEGYLKEAVQQILERNVSTSLKCMQSLVILNMCQSVKVQDLEKVVLAMQQNGTKLHQKYQRMYDNVCASAEEIAQEKASDRSRGALWPDPSRRDSKSRTISRHGYTQPTDLDFDGLKVNDKGEERRGVGKDIFEGMSAAGLDPVRTDNSLLKIEPHEFPEKAMRTLSNKYQVRDNGAKFFVAGRVFAILWHESVGEPRSSKKQRNPFDEGEKAGVKDKIDSSLSIGPYGEKIHSLIRRMVVIRQRHGYCWCIAINSYGGQGLKKPGLRKEERDAHTIIHDNRQSPQRLNGEPEIFRDPISVAMMPGETLIIASRLHYGKPYVVEWNTRVMDIGTVDDKCMPTLLTEARMELLP